MSAGYRVRKAKAEEKDAVYLMGYDAWADGQDLKTYLAGCRASPKYAKGTWYVLENAAGNPVSSLIYYELEAATGAPAIGIGSIATDPKQRKKGYAGRLISEVMALFRNLNSAQIFYLHADINPGFYEKLGFVGLSERHQTRAGSVVMVHGPKEALDRLLAHPDFQSPAYF